MIKCFCCYVIKSAGETARKVLSFIWNLLLIEIYLSQIRISHNKREKVCAVCPYLLFKETVDYTYTCMYWLFKAKELKIFPSESTLMDQVIRNFCNISNRFHIKSKSFYSDPIKMERKGWEIKEWEVLFSVAVSVGKNWPRKKWNPWHDIPNPSAVCMLRRHTVLLVAIRPSDGDVKPGGPLCAFLEEQATSRHWVSPSPFLSSSAHTTELHYTNSYTYSHPNLNFLQYIIQILVPHVMWSAQAVRELKIDHTQRHLSALRGTRST